MNLVEFLHRRQAGVEGGHVRRCLCRRVVPLPSIINPQLIHGHVILGFSQCGRYLLSYCNSMSDRDEHDYTLHWWTFHLYHPLSHLSEQVLFRAASDLHLIIGLTSDLTLAHGCMREGGAVDTRTCHVALLPGPGRSGPTILLKYDLLPPYPVFLPQLALRIPGCLLLNTGDRLVAVHYDTTHTACTHKQWFSSDPATLDTPVECSPSHLLPVEVHLNSKQLLPTTKSGVCVGQTVLDVEVWANSLLCSELDTRGLSYHCLLDYDLQVVQVCVEERVAVFVMAALLEVSNITGSYDTVSVEVVGAWDVCEGVTSVRRVTTPTIIPGHTHQPVSVRTRASSLRAQAHLPLGPQATVRTFSNHTVYSGKSLQFLNHPILPVTLALVKHTSP
ncbi:uncharacterized protein LOC135334832 [Halichondria panicea]|uniref:uncharacterized protein LOC135334832 n=1 Tax=Halichondria panicea TaxID=6063 RepID=UPI00312BA5BD